jgi:carboxypeptidase C (cathepsin A)
MLRFIKISGLIAALLSASWQLAAEQIQIDADSVVITEHRTDINGKRVNYKAHTGTQPVWDSEGNPTATLFYTYYQRTDIKDTARRPLLISRWPRLGVGLDACGLYRPKIAKR